MHTARLASYLLIGTLIACPVRSLATAKKPLFVDIGFSSVDRRPGAGVGMGFGLHFVRVRFDARLLDVTVVQGEGDDRYYLDQFANGQSRCRDRTNGQFAETSKCNTTDALFGAAAELAYVFILKTDRLFWVGGGARVGEGATPYLLLGGVLREAADLRLEFRAAGAVDFLQVGVLFAFDLSM